VESAVASAQLVIDFLMRNRRFIGAVVFLVGLGLRSATAACSWCHAAAEFAMAAGAYISGTGVDTSDRRVAVEQALRDGELPERRKVAP